MTDMLKTVNDANKQLITGLQNLQPISHDGLTCPKCGWKTVSSSGYSWCPNIGCDYGNELTIGKLITKWAHNLNSTTHPDA